MQNNPGNGYNMYNAVAAAAMEAAWWDQDKGWEPAHRQRKQAAKHIPAKRKDEANESMILPGIGKKHRLPLHPLITGMFFFILIHTVDCKSQST